MTQEHHLKISSQHNIELKEYLQSGDYIIKVDKPVDARGVVLHVANDNTNKVRYYYLQNLDELVKSKNVEPVLVEIK